MSWKSCFKSLKTVFAICCATTPLVQGGFSERHYRKMTKRDDSLFSSAVKCALDVNYSKVTSLSSGSLRNDDGDDYENVTQKVNLRCLKLSHAYSISFNSSNVGKSFLELNSKGLHQSSGKEKKIFLVLFPSSTKREIRQFHVIVVQRRQRNVQKSVAQLQSWCFACLRPCLHGLGDPGLVG